MTPQQEEGGVNPTHKERIARALYEHNCSLVPERDHKAFDALVPPVRAAYEHEADAVLAAVGGCVASSESGAGGPLNADAGPEPEVGSPLDDPVRIEAAARRLAEYHERPRTPGDFVADVKIVLGVFRGANV
jgi:hypothetical protein